MPLEPGHTQAQTAAAGASSAHPPTLQCAAQRAANCIARQGREPLAQPISSVPAHLPECWTAGVPAGRLTAGSGASPSSLQHSTKSGWSADGWRLSWLALGLRRWPCGSGRMGREGVGERHAATHARLCHDASPSLSPAGEPLRPSGDSREAASGESSSARSRPVPPAGGTGGGGGMLPPAPPPPALPPCPAAVAAVARVRMGRRPAAGWVTGCWLAGAVGGWKAEGAAYTGSCFAGECSGGCMCACCANACRPNCCGAPAGQPWGCSMGRNMSPGAPMADAPSIMPPGEPK